MSIPSLAQGLTADTSGRLKVIGILAGTALPAGTINLGGLALHTDGSLYVVIA